MHSVAWHGVCDELKDSMNCPIPNALGFRHLWMKLANSLTQPIRVGLLMLRKRHAEHHYSLRS